MPTTIDKPTKEQIKSELFFQYGKLIDEALFAQKLHIKDLNTFEYAALQFSKFREKNWDQIQAKKLEEMKSSMSTSITFNVNDITAKHSWLEKKIYQKIKKK